MFGLKINFSKIKIIWIGSKKFLKEVYYYFRWKFIEFDIRFNFLGISFLVNLEEMIDIYYVLVMEKIDKFLIRWNFRNFILIGKIIVIKIFIVLKINYLILILLSLILEFIRSFERKFFKFIWNEKLDKIKRSIFI